MSELVLLRREARALARASRPVPPSLRRRLSEAEAAERARVSQHRAQARRVKLCVAPLEDAWLAAHLPDGSLAKIGDASRFEWALTRNGEPVAWFRTRREAEAAARGAQTAPKALDHADMLHWSRILLGQVYAAWASRSRSRRPQCAELEWRLRVMLEGWALPEVIDRIARSRRGDATRHLERLGGLRVARSVWCESDLDPEEVF